MGLNLITLGCDNTGRVTPAGYRSPDGCLYHLGSRTCTSPVLFDTDTTIPAATATTVAIRPPAVTPKVDPAIIAHLERRGTSYTVLKDGSVRISM